MRTNQTKKRKISKVLSFVMVAFLLFTSMAFLPRLIYRGLPVAAYTENHTFPTFTEESLGIQNGTFTQTGSGNPADPTGWAEVSFAGAARPEAVRMGVFEQERYSTDLEYVNDLRLRDFSEFVDAMPRPLPRRDISQETTNDNFLMINTTRNIRTAIGFESSNISLEANGFYRISVWAKTAAFPGANAAAIRINGIEDYDIAFSNIRTLPAEDRSAQNFFGWEQFTFFIRTSALQSESISLTLSVGDHYIGLDRPDGRQTSIHRTATGYAFFDNVEAFRIAPTLFNQSYAHRDTLNNVRFVDLSLPALESTDPNYDVDLSFTADDFGWPANFSLQTSHEINAGDLAQPFVFDTSAVFEEEANPYNLPVRVESPLGRGIEDAVLAISSFDQRRQPQLRGEDAEYLDMAAGFVSNEITIPQLSFYRLSVWVNSHHVQDGAGVALEIKTDVIDPRNPGTDDEPNYISFSATSLSGSGASAATYGWQEYAFFIRGSFFRDYNITLGLWLGLEGQISRGTALFSNITLNRLTGEQFSAFSGMSAGGIVDIDGVAPSSTIGNGNFATFEVVEREEGEPTWPLDVAQWTFNTPASVSRVPFSQDTSYVEFGNMLDHNGRNRYISSGIMVNDRDHFEAHREDFGVGARLPNTDALSLLYMHASQPVIFNYTSSPFTHEGGAFSRVTTRLKVENVTGYGVSLVLLDSMGVISSIQNITTTHGQFADFDFYVGGNVDTQSLTLEIWLGYHERALFNRNFLSTGNVYVERVDIEEVTEDEFAEKNSDYISRVASDRMGNFAAFDFDEFGFNAFDVFDESFVRFPYRWSISGPPRAGVTGIRSGIFNSIDRENFEGNIPTTFRNRQALDENSNLFRHNVLMLSHDNLTASHLTFANPFNLEADSFYRLEVSIKVNIADEAGLGASIWLNDEFGFENISSRFSTVHNMRIMDTATVVDRIVDNEAFRYYTFYIYTGDQARSVMLSVGLGGARIEDFSRGMVFVNHVGFRSINNVEFQDAMRELTEDTDNVMAAWFGSPPAVEAPDEDTPTHMQTPAGLGTFMLPGILFGVAILLVLVIVVGRRALAHARARRERGGGRGKKGATVVKKAKYDRTAAKEAKAIDTFMNNQDLEKAAALEQEIFSGFDDDIELRDKEGVKKAPKTKSDKAIARAERHRQQKLERDKEEKAEAVVEQLEQVAEETKIDFIDSFDD